MYITSILYSCRCMSKMSPPNYIAKFASTISTSCIMTIKRVISMKLGMYDQFHFEKQVTSKYMMLWTGQVQKKQRHLLNYV